MVRHLISAAIVLFFLAMMSLLARDHILPWMQEDDSIAVSMSQVTDQWSGKDEWAEVQINGFTVGAMRSMAQRNEDGFEAHIKFAMSIFGRNTGTAQMAAQLNERLELDRFRASLTTLEEEEPTLELIGLVRGRTLHLRMASETGTKFTQLPVTGSLTLNLAADPFIGTTELVPGDTYRMDVYDPIWGGRSALRLSVSGRDRIIHNELPMEALVVDAFLSNMTMKIWLDENREAVRREIRLGMNAPTLNTEAEASETVSDIVVRMDRLDDVEDMRRYETLFALEEVPAFGPEEFEGQDTGEPLQAMGFLPTLVQGNLKAIIEGRRGARGSNQN